MGKGVGSRFGSAPLGPRKWSSPIVAASNPAEVSRLRQKTIRSCSARRLIHHARRRAGFAMGWRALTDDYILRESHPEQRTASVCHHRWHGPAAKNGNEMGNALRSILIRLVAYVAVAIAAGLLFLAGATVYELMWPRPVVPLSQMSNSP